MIVSAPTCIYTTQRIKAIALKLISILPSSPLTSLKTAYEVYIQQTMPMARTREPRAAQHEPASDAMDASAAEDSMVFAEFSFYTEKDKNTLATYAQTN